MASGSVFALSDGNEKSKWLLKKYRTVNMFSGDVAYYTIDSLSAFWPGLQVLAGDVENAIKLHLLCERAPQYANNLCLLIFFYRL